MRTKSESRKEAILEIAAELFKDKGFEATSMSEIAAKLGGSKGTLYNYFKSKEEIFVEVMTSSAREHAMEVFCQLKSGPDIKARLINFGHGYLKLITSPEIIAVHRLVISAAGKSDIGNYFYERGPKKGWQKISEFIEEEMNDGNIKKTDPFIAAKHLKALLEAEVYQKHLLGMPDKPNKKQISAIVERAVDVFLTAYRA